MAIQSDHGGFGSLQRAVAKAKGVTAVEGQGRPQASQHLVHDGVDDGAHGHHDYEMDLHPAILGRLDMHGSRLQEHDDRLKRLETQVKANLGSPLH